ncbi:MAG: glutathione peroxidase [Acidimicrobiia bacterium]
MATTDFSLNALDGSNDVLAHARGKAALFVNVASKCGLTPQYGALEALQREYADQGFTVIGFPCNQFLEQEPGTPEEIQAFCSTTYGVTFPLSEKIEVNGDARNALYGELTATPDAEGYTGDIRWNFEKFVIGRDGSIVARFAPQTAPDAPEVRTAIEAAIG